MPSVSQDFLRQEERERHDVDEDWEQTVKLAAKRMQDETIKAAQELCNEQIQQIAVDIEATLKPMNSMMMQLKSEQRTLRQQHERRAAATLLPQLGELARVQQAQQQQLMQLTEALCALSSGADGSTNAPREAPSVHGSEEAMRPTAKYALTEVRLDGAGRTCARTAGGLSPRELSPRRSGMTINPNVSRVAYERYKANKQTPFVLRQQLSMQAASLLPTINDVAAVANLHTLSSKDTAASKRPNKRANDEKRRNVRDLHAEAQQMRTALETQKSVLDEAYATASAAAAGVAENDPNAAEEGRVAGAGKEAEAEAEEAAEAEAQAEVGVGVRMEVEVERAVERKATEAVPSVAATGEEEGEVAGEGTAAAVAAAAEIGAATAAALDRDGQPAEAQDRASRRASAAGFSELEWDAGGSAATSKDTSERGQRRLSRGSPRGSYARAHTSPGASRHTSELSANSAQVSAEIGVGSLLGAGIGASRGCRKSERRPKQSERKRPAASAASPEHEQLGAWETKSSRPGTTESMRWAPPTDHPFASSLATTDQGGAASFTASKMAPEAQPSPRPSVSSRELRGPMHLSLDGMGRQPAAPRAETERDSRRADREASLCGSEALPTRPRQRPVAHAHSQAGQLAPLTVQDVRLNTILFDAHLGGGQHRSLNDSWYRAGRGGASPTEIAQISPTREAFAACRAAVQFGAAPVVTTDNSRHSGAPNRLGDFLEGTRLDISTPRAQWVQAKSPRDSRQATSQQARSAFHR